MGVKDGKIYSWLVVFIVIPPEDHQVLVAALRALGRLAPELKSEVISW
jgi:hypothetical protein